MEGSGNGYLRTVCDYTHLNPVRAKLLAPEDRLLAYPWSSFPLYLATTEQRPRWLRTDRLLGEHGIRQDTPAGRQEFESLMERRRLEAVDQEALKEFRQAWIIGGEAFRQECLEQMEGKVGENHLGQTRLETAEAKADRNLHKFINNSRTDTPQIRLDINPMNNGKQQAFLRSDPSNGPVLPALRPRLSA